MSSPPASTSLGIPQTKRAPQKEGNIEYALPPLIESVRVGWQTVFQSAAVVSTLLAGVAASLLSAINDDYPDVIENRSKSLRSILYIASFGAVIFNVSATMTSLVLIDRIAHLQFAAAHKPDVPRLGYLVSFDNYGMLRRYGLSSSWQWLVVHWLFSLLVGMWCILFQVILFVWVSEKTTIAVKVTMTCAIVIAAIPVVELLPYSRSKP